MRLYFVRHGESTANRLGEFSNCGFKHPLTETGIRQANTLARKLSSVPVERIYSSPLMRAVQTAQILTGTLRAPVVVTEALREWSVGIYEGTSATSGWEIHRRVQEDWFVRGQYDSKMPGGESFVEIRERFVPFIEELVKAGRHSDQAIVLVGHGGLYLAMLPVICKNISVAVAYSHGVPYSSYIVVETRPDGMSCVSWCGTPMV